ncbi:MAG: citramalate synthase, partial [Kiritimatiellia bacterium]
MKTYPRKIILYDTSLRDGSQAAGISFTGPGKLRLATRLDEFQIDYIEGGYAGSNPKDMEFFRQIAKIPLKRAKVVAFGMTRRAQTKVAGDPLVQRMLEAGTKIVTVVGKSWLLHVREVLRTTCAENMAMIADTIEYLKDHGREVFFDAEHFFDGYKENPDFAMATLEAATAAGADALVLCDTNGGTLPHEVFAITKQVVERFRVPIGIHTHNDSGLAVANALEAVRAGAIQVQGTINGYGERCGNADLCTLIPTLTLKMGFPSIRRDKLRRLRELSLFMDDLVNMRPNPRAPYVGESAFTHSAGLHVNAVKKNPRTFEHVPPEAVGNERRILVSELSGTSSVLLKAIELGVGRRKSLKGAAAILRVLKQMANHGYAFEAADASFRILIQKVLKEHKSFFDLEGFRVIVEKWGKDEPCISEATVKVRVKDQVEHTVAEGDGPVNALDRA